MEKPNSQIRIAKPFSNSAIEEQIISILRSGRLVQGKVVEALEARLAKYIGCKNVVCVNSGTAALHSSFLSLKPRNAERNEVVTTPLSFAATANAVIHAGCKPVFADVDPETFNIDPEKAEEKINDKTLAVEPVDVYGLPADLDSLIKAASSRGVPVVEDAAEAIGAKYHSKKIGTISTLSCFSTYATKNLHTAEGGFVTTNNDLLASRLRLIRNQGQASRYNQVVLGYNFRMLEFCGAIGLEQLPQLDELNGRRRENSLYLKERLSKLDPIGFQKVDDPTEHAWYMFSLTLNENEAGMSRDSFISKMKERGIEADVAWPLPIHLQPYFKETFGFKVGDFPTAERICKEVFQLPIHPFLSRENLERIVQVTKEVLS